MYCTVFCKIPFPCICIYTVTQIQALPLLMPGFRCYQHLVLPRLHISGLQLGVPHIRFLAFKGKTVYSRTADEVEKATDDLLNLLHSKTNQMAPPVLGFDIEWKPTFSKGVPPGKAAVMQICCDTNTCHVMHIIHSGIPHNLKSLLMDPTLIKVGVGIAYDASKVLKDHNVSIEGLEDLSDLANQKLIADPKKWSLASLTETLICKQLPKPMKIRGGNWEADMLSKQQLDYAANDAFASWFLYEALKKLPDGSGVVADPKTKLKIEPKSETKTEPKTEHNLHRKKPKPK